MLIKLNELAVMLAEFMQKTKKKVVLFQQSEEMKSLLPRMELSRGAGAGLLVCFIVKLIRSSLHSFCLS